MDIIIAVVFAIGFYCRILHPMAKHCQDCERFREFCEEEVLA